MNFKDPSHVFTCLSGFPHVLYRAMTFGDWNTMVITDRLIDFSQLVGFKTMIFQGVRYHSYTPETPCISWSESFERCSHQIERFTPHNELKNRQLTPALTWNEDEWKMYCAFKNNTRKPATTTLQKIGVRYETYVTWMEDLNLHCAYHTGFYPEGYSTYLTYCFLFSTDYEKTVKDLFSSFPTTPFIMEVGNNIMIFASVVRSEVKRRLFCSIYDMKTQGIVKTFNHASLISQDRFNSSQKRQLLVD
ncbi:MAG: hypothetical protein HXS42_14440 [Theionarchaea archaeon]|nr:hypothetical protein [Theionarchaea archaeon]